MVLVGWKATVPFARFLNQQLSTAHTHHTQHTHTTHSTHTRHTKALTREIHASLVCLTCKLIHSLCDSSIYTQRVQHC